MPLECMSAIRITPHLAKLWTDSAFRQIHFRQLDFRMHLLVWPTWDWMISIWATSVCMEYFVFFLLNISTCWLMAGFQLQCCEPSKRRAFWNRCFWWLMDDDGYGAALLVHEYSVIFLVRDVITPFCTFTLHESAYSTARKVIICILPHASNHCHCKP